MLLAALLSLLDKMFIVLWDKMLCDWAKESVSKICWCEPDLTVKMQGSSVAISMHPSVQKWSKKETQISSISASPGHQGGKAGSGSRGRQRSSCHFSCPSFWTNQLLLTSGRMTDTWSLLSGTFWCQINSTALLWSDSSIREEFLHKISETKPNPAVECHRNDPLKK